MICVVLLTHYMLSHGYFTIRPVPPGFFKSYSVCFRFCVPSQLSIVQLLQICMDKEVGGLKNECFGLSSAKTCEYKI